MTKIAILRKFEKKLYIFFVVVVGHIPDFCKSNPTTLFANWENAAQYFDCSKPSSQLLIPYLHECDYPYLFDGSRLTCSYFTSVPVDTRPIPRAPCNILINYKAIVNVFIIQQVTQPERCHNQR